MKSLWALALAWTTFFLWRLSKPPGLMLEEFLALGRQQGVHAADWVGAFSVASGLLVPLLLLAGFILGAWALGDAALGGRASEEPLAATVLRSAFGLGALMLLATIAGMLGLLRPAFFWGLWALLAAAGTMRALKHRRSWRGLLSRAAAAPGERALAAALALLALLELFLCATPEVVYDSLMYHLALARLYSQHERVIAVPWNLYSQFPYGLGMLYAWALGLAGSETLPKLLHWFMGLAAAAAAAALAARWQDRRAAWLAALVFASMPVVFLNATSAMSDLAVAFFALSAFLALEPWLESPSEAHRPAALSGFLCGCALACKYTAGFAALAMSLLIIAAAWRGPRGLRGAAAAAAVFSACALIPFAPWLIKNALLQGNPISPFAASLIGDAGVSASELAGLRAESTFPLTEASWRGWLKLPWVLSSEGKGWHHWVGPVFWLFAWAPFFRSRKPRSWPWAAAFVGLFYLAWSAQSHVARYFLPALGVMAALWGAGLSEAAKARGWRATIAALFACAMLINVQGALAHFLFQHEALPFLSGSRSRDEYLSRPLPDLYPAPSYAALSWADSHLPADARILLLGETRAYHSPRRFIAVSTRNEQPLVSWIKNDDDLVGRLAAQGVTHLLVNESEAKRTGLTAALATLTPPQWERFNRFWSARLRSVHRSAAAEIFEVRRDGSAPAAIANPFWDDYWKDQSASWKALPPSRRREKLEDLRSRHPETSVACAELARDELIARRPDRALKEIDRCLVASDELGFLQGAALIQARRWTQAEAVLSVLWRRRPDIPAVKQQLDLARARSRDN